jgi:hypothetical protein
MRKEPLALERHQNGTLPTIWVTRLPSARLWITQADYLVRVPVEGELVEILVPLGFRFDIASVPRVAWSIIAPFELSLAAPLAHDFLYERNGRLDGREKPLTRKESDDAFLYLMRREGIPELRARIAHAAVRVGGGRAWRRYLRGKGRRN